MATTAPTETKVADEVALNLTPPDPVPVVAAEKAAGLVPIDEGKKSKLDERVDVFVEELAALDAASPEFGQKVDQITNMGRKEITEAAGHSNRFLDRPVKAMNQEGGVGADLAELRRVVEDLDPGKKGNLLAPKKIFGIIPYGNKLRNYFDSYKSALRGYSALAAVLLSAGGNDFAGFDDFQKILLPDCSKCAQPADWFDGTALANLIGTVEQSYEKLIHAALALRPGISILIHNYDYAIPTGKGFLGLGQWLKAPMDARHVPDPDDLRPGSFRRELIKILINRLGSMQQTLAAQFGGLVIQVPTPGTLADDQWANELHAAVDGFDKLGKECFAPILAPIIVPPAGAQEVSQAVTPAEAPAVSPPLASTRARRKKAA